MVSEQQDMLDYVAARPAASSKIALVKEIAENGEAIVAFEDGRVVEFHGNSTHFYEEIGAMFTEEDEAGGGDEAESWFFADEIVSVQRH